MTPTQTGRRGDHYDVSFDSYGLLPKSQWYNPQHVNKCSNVKHEENLSQYQSLMKIVNIHEGVH